jgi:hypothetical protein
VSRGEVRTSAQQLETIPGATHLLERSGAMNAVEREAFAQREPSQLFLIYRKAVKPLAR